MSSEEDKRHVLRPEHVLMRIVEVVEGTCEMVMTLRLRPDFGVCKPTLRRLSPSTVRFTLGRRVLCLAAGRELQECHDGEVKGAWTVAAGEQLSFSLCYGEDGPLVLVSFGERPTMAQTKTVTWWREWIAHRCRVSRCQLRTTN